MVLDSAIIGSVVTGSIGLAGMIINKIKCIFKHDSCNDPVCACGFIDKPIIEENHNVDIDVIHVNDVELIYVSRKTRDISDSESE